MPKIKNVAVLLNLSHIYDRQIIHGISRYLTADANSSQDGQLPVLPF